MYNHFASAIPYNNGKLQKPLQKYFFINGFNDIFCIQIEKKKKKKKINKKYSRFMMFNYKIMAYDSELFIVNK